MIIATRHSNLQADRRCTQQASAGFTLLELLAALVLASLLTTALLQLVRNVHRKTREVTELAGQEEHWTSQTFNLLQQDLRNSRRMAISGNQIQLTGFAGTNPQSGIPNHTSAEVIYRIVISGDRRCLQREERILQTLTNTSIHRRIVAVDVVELSFWFADAPNMNWSSPQQATPDWMPIPAAIIAQVGFARTNASRNARSTDKVAPSTAIATQRQTLMVRPGSI